MRPQTGSNYAFLGLLGALALLGYKEAAHHNVTARQFLAIGAIGSGALLLAPVAPGLASILALLLVLVTARSALAAAPKASK